MLLTHRSGIQGDILVDFTTRETVDPQQFQRRILELLSGRPLLFEPGEYFSYSNAGYALLGIIIEEVSGLSYGQYIRQNIFDRAGMEDSLVYPREKGYELPLGYGMGGPLPPPHIRDMAAGSLLVSSRDMMKFIDALFSGKIILEETWQNMIRSHNQGNPIDRSFSIGLSYWLNNPLNTADRIAAHGGDLPPFQALLVIMPDRESAVFTAANDMPKGEPLAINTGIQLLKDLLEYEERVPLENLQISPPMNLGFSGELSSFAGIYNTVVGPLEIGVKKGDPFIKMMGKKLHLIKDETGWWKLQVRILGIPIKIDALEALSLDMFTVEGTA
jgi:CubicO group peptidase (beta-lactamase class C family)